eukprot:SAG31_NODE_7876_length_1576_cov_1.377793_1_plen_79_part_00
MDTAVVLLLGSYLHLVGATEIPIGKPAGTPRVHRAVLLTAAAPARGRAKEATYTKFSKSAPCNLNYILNIILDSIDDI